MSEIVFYRMSSDLDRRQIETFPSAAAAKRWIAMMKAGNLRHPDEAQFFVEPGTSYAPKRHRVTGKHR